MTVTLVTVPDIPIVSTGTYQLASGETTFSAEDLADAVQAAQDPTVPAPRLKLGHNDPRFDEAIASGELDGEPAFGTVTNLRLSADGQTVIGDYSDVPEWLADTLPSSFPGRSIEGGFGYTAPSGRTYRLVIARVALLGVTWPGVTSLDDLREVLSENGEAGADLEPVEAASERFVLARVSRPGDEVLAAVSDKAWDGSASRFTDEQYAASCVLDRAKCSADWKDKPAKQRYSLPVKEPNGDLNRNAVHAAAQRIGSVSACDEAKSAAKASLRSAYKTLGEDAPDSIKAAAAGVEAGLDLGNVRMQFCGDLDDGEVPKVPDGQPQADDVGPQIWWWPRSVRVEDDGSLCLIVDDDEGHLIRIPFTVTQGDLIYGNPELVIETYVPVMADPDDSQSNGQPVSARGPRVLASWPVRAASRPSTTTEVTTMDVDAAVLRKRLGLAEDADDAAIQAALEAEPETEETPPEHASAPEIPEGMALVDEATLTELRSGAQKAEQVAARLAREDRDKVIAAAIEQGKFPVSRREHYERAWDADEEGARTLIASLAPGLVPVGRREIGGAGDGEGQQSEEAEHEAFMARHFPNDMARLANRNGGRVRVRQEA